MGCTWTGSRDAWPGATSPRHRAANASRSEKRPDCAGRRTPHDTPHSVPAMTMLQLVRAWALIAVVMIANGIFRELVVAPRTGAATAEVISVALGITWIV